MAKRGREGVEVSSDQGKTLRLAVHFQALELTTASGERRQLSRLKDPTQSQIATKPANLACEKEEKSPDLDANLAREKAEYERLIGEIEAEDSLFEGKISTFRGLISAFSQSLAAVSALEKSISDHKTESESALLQETAARAAQIKARDQLEDKLKRVWETERKLDEEAVVLAAKTGEIRLQSSGLESDNEGKCREIADLQEEMSRLRVEIGERLQASEALSAKEAEETISLEALRREIAQYSGLAA